MKCLFVLNIHSYLNIHVNQMILFNVKVIKMSLVNNIDYQLNRSVIMTRSKTRALALAKSRQVQASTSRSPRLRRTRNQLKESLQGIPARHDRGMLIGCWRVYANLGTGTLNGCRFFLLLVAFFIYIFFAFLAGYVHH